VAWRDRLEEPVAAVIDALPAGTELGAGLRVGLVSSFPGVAATALPPVHRQRLEQPVPDEADVVFVDLERRSGPWGDRQAFELAFVTALEALDVRCVADDGGIPDTAAWLISAGYALLSWTDGDPRGAAGGCTARGTAQEAVALYLAARATPATARGFELALRSAPYGFTVGASADPYGNAFDDPQDTVSWHDAMPLDHGVTPAPDRRFTASRSGGLLAEQLLRRDPGEVLPGLHQDWSRWTSAATGSESLAAAFDLRMPATPEESARAAGVDWTKVSENLPAG
jgi:hypothetical protein